MTTEQEKRKLKDEALEAYLKQRQPINDAYAKQCKQVDDAHEKQRQLIDDAYAKQCKQIYDAYNKRIAEIDSMPTTEPKRCKTCGQEIREE